MGMRTRMSAEVNLCNSIKVEFLKALHVARVE